MSLLESQPSLGSHSGRWHQNYARPARISREEQGNKLQGREQHLGIWDHIYTDRNGSCKHALLERLVRPVLLWAANIPGWVQAGVGAFCL